LTLARGADGILFWQYGRAPERRPHHETLRSIYFGPEGNRSSLFERQLELVKATHLQKGTISKHVAALRREGLVKTDRLDVTDAGVERLRQLFPDDDFES
jgi:hypothetical protein